MDKYVLLLILNLPFVIFGTIKAFMLFETKRIGKASLFLRLLLWGIILSGLIFSEDLYRYLSEQGLTDSAPLSIADVILVTGVVFSIFMCLRLYSRVDDLETRLSDLNEELSILLSDKKP